jgi:hypothetical protein
MLRIVNRRKFYHTLEFRNAIQLKIQSDDIADLTLHILLLKKINNE